MKLRLAIDANEANTDRRVGSNVYAFELLRALEELTRSMPVECTVLLAHDPIDSLPKARPAWKYRVFGPKKFWTQWALPLHLHQHRDSYDLLFSPSHYAPRISAVPYVSAVMDTAYLEFPEQFTFIDRMQLTLWTRYSVKAARHIITISQHARESVLSAYQEHPSRVSVIYPAATPIASALSLEDRTTFFKKHHITEPYILYVGTLQPRKNLGMLISAFESFSQLRARNARRTSSASKSHSQAAPCLVLAGKVGWLAEPILERIHESPFRSRIITPGFVTDQEKRTLYESALCTTLVGSHEGFGMPPLEAMRYGSIPVVADATSLPEVVGSAGYLVPPGDTRSLAQAFLEISQLSIKERAIWRRKGREQAQQFSWATSAAQLLKLLFSVYSTSKSS